MTTTRPNELNNGIFTSWIPFTTAGVSITPACSSAMYLVPGGDSIIAFDPWQGKNIPFALQCLPAEVTSSWAQNNPSTRLSLGPFHCPSAFTTATSSAINSISTSVVCCPTDYGYTQSGLDQGCISTLKSGSIVPKSIYAPSGVWESWVDTTVTAVPTTVLAANVNGYVFAAATTSSSITSSKTSSSKSTPASQVPATTTKKSTATKVCKSSSGKKTTRTHCKSSLGAGAIAGIVIGAVLGVLALIALFIFLRRRKRKQQAEPETIYHEKDGSAASNELAAGGLPPKKRGSLVESEVGFNHPLAANNTANLPAFAGGHEIAGSSGVERSGPHEMDGGSGQPIVRGNS